MGAEHSRATEASEFAFAVDNIILNCAHSCDLKSLCNPFHLHPGWWGFYFTFKVFRVECYRQRCSAVPDDVLGVGRVLVQGAPVGQRNPTSLEHSEAAVKDAGEAAYVWMMVLSSADYVKVSWVSWSILIVGAVVKGVLIGGYIDPVSMDSVSWIPGMFAVAWREPLVTEARLVLVVPSAKMARVQFVPPQGIPADPVWHRSNDGAWVDSNETSEGEPKEWREH